MNPKPIAEIFFEAEQQFPKDRGKSKDRGLLTEEKEKELGRDMAEAREALKAMVRRLPEDCRAFVMPEDREKSRKSKVFGFEEIWHLCGKLTEYAKKKRGRVLRELAHEADLERARYMSAYSLLYHANIGLVFKVARSYYGDEVYSSADILQDGNIGLVDAVERYDYRYNNKFSTHAFPWIRRRILEGMNEQKRTIRLPSKIAEQVNKISRRRGELFTRGVAAEDLDSAVAKDMDLSEKKVSQLMILAQEPKSINARLSSHTENGSDLFMVLSDHRTPSPEDICAENEMRGLVTELLSCLDARQRDVVERFLGFGDYVPRQTLNEIGIVHGLCRERVRQIYEEALQKLKRVVKKRHGHYADLVKFFT
ncbi:MAG: sigma-70 family RNA polymerase sigma factor [Patescibacteria group bacterium]